MRGVLIACLTVSSAAHALPPGADPALRDGANHRVGDDSAIGVAPRSEKERMATHLAWIRQQLAAKPATRPELAAKRAELLGYLDDYIAKGITPVNEHLPWRTPVFIDDHGNVCAVGYLIERSVGRALPDKIAAEHRYEFLEDIAAAMPEVRAWVASSGLTLDELASIQPGYAEPVIEGWGNASYVAMKAPDGVWEDGFGGGQTKGTLKKGHMEGAWTRTVDGTLVGKGQFARGAGTWTSFYADGKVLARGSFSGDRPHGAWKLYHASGNLAAAGEFRRGTRSGAWQFYYDTKARTPIATGQFGGPGSVVGVWRHYDATGALLATSRTVGKGSDSTSRGAILMSIVPGNNGAAHEVHAMGGMDSAQLHMIAKRGVRLYATNFGAIYDPEGNRIERDGSGWTAASCGWSKKRKAIAASGDVSTLHRLIRDDSTSKCGDKVAVTKARATAISDTLGAFASVRVPSPAFVRELALGSINMTDVAIGDSYDEDMTEEETETQSSARSKDLVRILTASLAWYIEWPHIDGRFAGLFPTIPGHGQKFEIYEETTRRNPEFSDRSYDY